MDRINDIDAVVFHGPFNATIEKKPVRQIQGPEDVILKVMYTALCGSELHVFRGNQTSDTGFIMGHEFTGTIHQVGSAVKTVQLGDCVVCPFTVSCGTCFYCENGISSRCKKGMLFGSLGLDGSQAEYVRVPYADGTVLKTPADVNPVAVVLMADIFPTGFFAARNAFRNLSESQISKSVVVVLGCGPVGLCALLNAVEYHPKHLLAVDMVEYRLNTAKSFRAEPWNLSIDSKRIFTRVKALTDGRGADLVIEVVGNSAALRTAFDLLRPSGTISSVGVHNSESSQEAYAKNLNIQMGRCPARSIFPQALQIFKKKTQEQLSVLNDTVVPLSRAGEYYELFEKSKVQKVVFKV
ncbi:hypothetical protein NPX13_g9382 [Xylaria arbuscula]|uniref:Enoyl reductase (ER) domain-containing protein n=1 Tax=Xylaria arbuscula TaxID=114810 RepID=A0A9W8N6T0_9PEZI|nr:hypothetical protein NPX13_g9382 [Xylaria arbuscula]